MGSWTELSRVDDGRRAVCQRCNQDVLRGTRTVVCTPARPWLPSRGSREAARVVKMQSETSSSVLCTCVAERRAAPDAVLLSGLRGGMVLEMRVQP